MSHSTCWRRRKWSSWLLSANRASFLWRAMGLAQIPRPQQTLRQVRLTMPHSPVIMQCSLQ